MQLRIQVPDGFPVDTRAAIERKVRLALGRRAAGIERTQVTLFASEGPAAVCCRIRIRLRNGERLAVEDGAEDPRAAAAAAAWRIEHRMQRLQAATADGALTSRRVGFR